MSKFIDKVKRFTQATPAPMGFHSASAQEKPKMLLVAIIGLSVKNISGLIEGADAAALIINDLGQGTESIRKLNKAAPEIPWGMRLKDIKWGENEIPECDFMIFPPDMPVLALPEKMGRIMEIDITTNDSILRAIDELPVEAVFIDGKPGEPLTWQYLASIQRLDNLISKPIIIRLPDSVKGDELPALWRVGVDASVIEVSPAQTADRLSELRKAVNTASFPLPRKNKKNEVILPFIQPEPEHEEAEEEPEEE